MSDGTGSVFSEMTAIRELNEGPDYNSDAFDGVASDVDSEYWCRCDCRHNLRMIIRKSINDGKLDSLALGSVSRCGCCDRHSNVEVFLCEEHSSLRDPILAAIKNSKSLFNVIFTIVGEHSHGDCAWEL